MSQKQSETELATPRRQIFFVPPKYTLGYMTTVIGVTLLTSWTILSGNYSQWQADGQKIIDEHQWYRLITGPFAVASFLDLSFMLISFLWLLFTLTDYQIKYSTLYTIYHFWKANICINFAVAMMYFIMFTVTGMKNFIMNVGGIYPYTVHIYLKTCLENPSKTVNHWFLPYPINKWLMGLLVAILSMFLAPQSQGCLAVLLYYLWSSFRVLLKNCTGCAFFYSEGPLFGILFRALEYVMPKCVTKHYAYCSIKESLDRQNKNDQDHDEKGAHELVQQAIIQSSGPVPYVPESQVNQKL